MVAFHEHFCCKILLEMCIDPKYYVRFFRKSHAGRMLQSIFGHQDIVTCITFCPERGLYGIPGDGLIASGSHDATVLLWRWSGRETQGLSIQL